jgi:AMP-binding enzyme.
MFDCINFPITFRASIWTNIIPICVNTMHPKQDLEYMLRDSQENAVICSTDLL